MNLSRWARVLSRVILVPLLSAGQMMSDAKPKIWGIEIARPSGGFLGVSIGERTFVVRFYDQDKGGIPADVFRGSVRGREMGQVDEAAQEFGP